MSKDSSTADRLVRVPFSALLGIAWIIYAAGTLASYFTLGPERTTTVSLGFGLVMAGLITQAVRQEKRGENDEVKVPPSWVVFLVFLLAATPAAWVWNQGQLIPDEGTYAFQARQIRAGGLSSVSPLTVLPDTPAARKATQFIHTLHHRGRWFGKYPPGWPVVLAAGQALGLDWLANVLLAAVLLAVTGRLATELATPLAGWLAVVLMASSPYFWFTVMGRMSHVASGALLAAAAFLALRAVRARSLTHLAGALACVGAATLVRPYTAAVLGGLTMAIALAALRGTPVLGRALVLAGVAGLSSVALNAGYNLLLTGSPWLSPYSLYLGVEGIPLELRPTLATIRNNVLYRLRWELMNSVLFTGPLLLFAAAYALRKGSPKRVEAALLGVLAASLILAHLPATMPPGGRWGGRFHSEGLFAYITLAAIGAEAAAAPLGRRRFRQLLIAFLASQALTLALYYPHYLRDGRPVGLLRAAVDALPPVRATVFLASENDPRTLAMHFNPNGADWANAPHVFLVDPGAEARPALACALKRPAWFLLIWDGARRTVKRKEGTFACSAN